MGYVGQIYSVAALERADNVDYGPVEHTNGDLYCVIADITNTAVRMMKSTDGGVNWSEVDSANHPTFGNMDACLVVHISGVIYVIRMDGSGGGAGWWENPFTISTDSWGTPVNTGLATYLWTSANAYKAYARSDGTIVLAALSTEKIHGSDYLRPTYAIRSSGGTWGGWNIIAGSGLQQNHQLYGVASGLSDRTHFWTGLGGLSSHRTLNSSDTLETANAVTSAGTGVARLLGNKWTQSSVNYVGILREENGGVGDTDLSFGRFSDVSSATPPSVETFTNIRSDCDQTVAYVGKGNIVPIGSTVWAVYVQSTTQDIVVIDDSGSNSWSSPTTVSSDYNYTAIMGVFLKSDGKTIGIIAHEGSAPMVARYIEYDTAPAAFIAPAPKVISQAIRGSEM